MVWLIFKGGRTRSHIVRGKLQTTLYGRRGSPVGGSSKYTAVMVLIHIVRVVLTYIVPIIIFWSESWGTHSRRNKQKHVVLVVVTANAHWTASDRLIPRRGSCCSANVYIIGDRRKRRPQQLRMAVAVTGARSSGWRRVVTGLAVWQRLLTLGVYL